MHLLHELWRDSTRELGRTFLTLLGIVLGSASIVVLASLLSAAGQALGRTSQEAAGEDVTRVHDRASRNADIASRDVALRETDIHALSQYEHLPAGAVAGSNALLGQDASVSAKRMKVGVQSGGSEYARMAKMELAYGRWLAPEEDGERVCLIGYDVWRELYASQWPLPQPSLLYNDGTRFTVVGVFASRPPLDGAGGDGTWMFDRKIWVSNSTFLRSVRRAPGFGEIAIVHPPEGGQLPRAKDVALRLTPYLRNLHFGSENFEFDALSKDTQTSELVVLALGAVMILSALVAMVVGAVNVMNAQLVSVQEKTREYGIRRALGLSARRLHRAVLVESCLYALIGSVLGIGLGLGVAALLALAITATFMPWPFEVVSWSIGGALASALAAGVLAGWVPARRAAHIAPSECLRSE